MATGKPAMLKLQSLLRPFFQGQGEDFHLHGGSGLLIFPFETSILDPAFYNLTGRSSILRCQPSYDRRRRGEYV